MESTFLFFLTLLFTAVMAGSKNEEALHVKAFSTDSRRSNQKSLENGLHLLYFDAALQITPPQPKRKGQESLFLYLLTEIHFSSELQVDL